MDSCDPVRQDRTARRNLRKLRSHAGRQEWRAILPKGDASSSGAAFCTDSRISPVKKNVGEEIAAHEKEGGEQHAADNDIEITRQYGLQQERPETWPAHHDFDEQRSAQQRATAETKQGDERIRRRAQSVAIQQRTSGK